MRAKNVVGQSKLSELLYEAQQALQAHAFEIAKKKFEACLKLAPQNPRINLGMAQTFEALEITEKAGQYFYKSMIFSGESPEYEFE